ncbi:MAG: AAA family ATPase [Anaerolineae bacterium]
MQGARSISALGVIIGFAVAGAVAILAWLYLRRRARRREEAAKAAGGRPSSASTEASWPAWETSIRNALLQHGWVDEYFLSSSIPQALWVPAMRRYVEEHGDDALLFHDMPPRIELANRRRMKTFLHSWKSAWELIESEENFHDIVSDIAGELCSVLGFVQVPEKERIYRHLHGFVVRAPALRLKVPPRFPIIFVRRREGSPEDLTDLRNLMSILEMTSYFALIIDLNDFADHLDQRKNLKNLVRDTIHDFIVLNGNDLRQILIARDPGKRLVEIILQQVDLTVVSPYVTSGPVPENMFFGREHELKTITRKIGDTSFALVGGRKIGKTSTLVKVYRLLCENGGPERTFYLDCQSVTSTEAFFEAANALWKLDPPIDSPEALRRYLVAKDDGSHAQPVVVLLDEVDGLINYDVEHDHNLFKVLRALSQQRRCRFVFCGERVLHAQLHAADSPLFNFCDVIHLGYLKETAAQRIIREPMQTMGIAIQNPEEVVAGIIHLSSCHPNLVQYLCQQLILEANNRHSRQITPADLNRVRHSSSFHEYYLEVTWGNTTPLERAITLLIADRDEISFGEIQETVTGRGFEVGQEQVAEAVSGLRLNSILLKEGQQYRFSSAVFADVVRESQEIEILLNALGTEMEAHAERALPERVRPGDVHPVRAQPERT